MLATAAPALKSAGPGGSGDGFAAPAGPGTNATAMTMTAAKKLTFRMRNPRPFTTTEPAHRGLTKPSRCPRESRAPG